MVVTGNRLERLLVVSSSIHYAHEGASYAYGPYVREIDVWADLFDHVDVAAPCRYQRPPGDCLPFSRRNIRLCPQLVTGGKSLWAKAAQVVQLPRIGWRLTRAMRGADAIHVRCPGNLGLLGTLLAPLYSKYRIAKYAGQWNGYQGERLAVRLQRRLLASAWWGQPVTVYGDWPGQPRHVKSFFTSMMDSHQVEHAARVAESKRIHSPLRVLFSGRLAKEKRVDTLLHAVRLLRDAGHAVQLTLVGDGNQRRQLESLVRAWNLERQVRFIGAVPFADGLRWYEWADCLVLPSVHSEGWPKVLAEAMCFGVACVAVRHGQVTRMLEDRGTLLNDGTPQEIADALQAIAETPERFRTQMRAASQWSCQYSLPRLRDALAALLTAEWGIEMNWPAPAVTGGIVMPCAGPSAIPTEQGV